MFEHWKIKGNQELQNAINGYCFGTLSFHFFESRVAKAIELYDKAPCKNENGQIDNFRLSTINKNKSVAVRNLLERLVVLIEKDLAEVYAPCSVETLQQNISKMKKQIKKFIKFQNDALFYGDNV